MLIKDHVFNFSSFFFLSSHQSFTEWFFSPEQQHAPSYIQILFYVQYICVAPDQLKLFPFFCTSLCFKEVFIWEITVAKNSSYPTVLSFK